jgi:Rrf2 family iron-sulfur cluster assembly transcriptional regulator
VLRPSRKVMLALEAVVDIAVNGTSGPVQSQDIADRLNLPRRYLEQVMQQLVRSGVLRGVRGPRGGYRLAREQRRIAVGEVLRIAAKAEKASPRDWSTSDLGAAVLEPFWDQLAADTTNRLDGISIEDLAKRARDAGLGAHSAHATDFVI